MHEENELTAENALAEQAKQLFDESVERMDGQKLSQLNRARQTALAQVKPRKPTIVQWGPLTGLAAATAAAVVFWPPQPKTDHFAIPPTASDMEMLLTEESLEMFADLEFYSWIELEEEATELDESENNVS